MYVEQCTKLGRLAFTNAKETVKRTTPSVYNQQFCCPIRPLKRDGCSPTVVQ
jgi:hypothetical protein